MIRSRFSSFLAMAAMCLASAFSATWRTVDAAAAQVYRVYRTVRDAVLDFGCKMVASLAEPVRDERFGMLKVQVRAFVLRQAKRQRPELTGSWRMCPST